MSGLFFLLAFLSLVSLFLFEEVYIKVKRTDILEIEIHFVFFVLILKTKKKQKEKPAPSPKSIIRSVLRLCRSSMLNIKELTFRSEARDSLEEMETFYRYRALTGALLAFVYQNSENVSVDDGFFTVDFSRTSPPVFDVNIRTYVFDALIALSPLLLSLIKRKRKRTNA